MAVAVERTESAPIPQRAGMLRQGIPGRALTTEDRRRGQARRWEKVRERRARAELEAARLLAQELVPSIKTYFELRDDKDAPEGVRLQAADRVVDRVLGKATERVEFSGPGGGAIEVLVAHVDLDREAVLGKLRQAGIVIEQAETVSQSPESEALKALNP